MKLFSIIFFGLFILFSNNSHAQRVNSRYIKRFPYSITVKSFIGTKPNEFKLEDNLTSGTLNYKVAAAPRLGAGISYKWFSVSSSLFKLSEPNENQKGITNQFDLQWNFYLRFFSIDLRMQRHEGYYLENSKTIKNWDEIKNGLYQRSDLITSSLGGNIRYNLNYKKYSPRAIFSQTERQLKSAGSLSYGFRWNILNMESDSSIIPANLNSTFVEFKLDRLYFSDFGYGFGYGYTFVRDQWFFNIGFMGFIVHQNVKFIENGTLQKQISLQVNFQSRTALGYSNDKIYIGFNAVSDQMYSNWKNTKNIIYSFSKIRVIFAKRIHTRPIKVEKEEIWN
tara:strand:- start:688 stop:1698 length:1011 start_codon:yes stop_codon:yes gene_type:complete